MTADPANDTNPVEETKNVDPEMIRQMAEGQMRVIQCGQQMHRLAGQAQQFISAITCNNPRLALALTNELHLIYDEAVRRNLKINVSDSDPGAAETVSDEKAEEEMAGSPHGDGQEQA